MHTIDSSTQSCHAGARFLVISHEVRLLEHLLQDEAQRWQVHEVIKLQRGNLHPRIYALQRV